MLYLKKSMNFEERNITTLRLYIHMHSFQLHRQIFALILIKLVHMFIMYVNTPAHAYNPYLRNVLQLIEVCNKLQQSVMP